MNEEDLEYGIGNTPFMNGVKSWVSNQYDDLSQAYNNFTREQDDKLYQTFKGMYNQAGVDYPREQYQKDMEDTRAMSEGAAGMLKINSVYGASKVLPKFEGLIGDKPLEPKNFGTETRENLLERLYHKIADGKSYADLPKIYGQKKGLEADKWLAKELADGRIDDNEYYQLLELFSGPNADFRKTTKGILYNLQGSELDNVGKKIATEVPVEKPFDINDLVDMYNSFPIPEVNGVAPEIVRSVMLKRVLEGIPKKTTLKARQEAWDGLNDKVAEIATKVASNPREVRKAQRYLRQHNGALEGLVKYYPEFSKMSMDEQLNLAHSADSIMFPQGYLNGLYEIKKLNNALKTYAFDKGDKELSSSLPNFITGDVRNRLRESEAIRQERRLRELMDNYPSEVTIGDKTYILDEEKVKPLLELGGEKYSKEDVEALIRYFKDRELYDDYVKFRMNEYNK